MRVSLTLESELLVALIYTNVTDRRSVTAIYCDLVVLMSVLRCSAYWRWTTTRASSTLGGVSCLQLV